MTFDLDSRFNSNHWQKWAVNWPSTGLSTGASYGPSTWTDSGMSFNNLSWSSWDFLAVEWQALPISHPSHLDMISTFHNHLQMQSKLQSISARFSFLKNFKKILIFSSAHWSGPRTSGQPDLYGKINNFSKQMKLIEQIENWMVFRRGWNCKDWVWRSITRLNSQNHAEY